jgi:hypothetical protein
MNEEIPSCFVAAASSCTPGPATASNVMSAPRPAIRDMTTSTRPPWLALTTSAAPASSSRSLAASSSVTAMADAPSRIATCIAARPTLEAGAVTRMTSSARRCPMSTSAPYAVR